MALVIDGIGGVATVGRLQEFLGVKADKVISGQSRLYTKYRKALTSVKYGKGGSKTVSELQRWLSITQDGGWGKKTSLALQKRLVAEGYSVGKDGCDGFFGKDSMMALQKYLNEHDKAVYPTPTPTPTPTPSPSTLGDKIMDACKTQADWMKKANYGHWKPVTIAHSKTWGTCVTYEGCVLQRLGYKKEGGYVYQNGSGKGTGKVTHTNSKMTTTYMNNKKLSSLKSVIQKGDILLFDDTKDGHVCFATGDWKGSDPYVWDVGKKMICERTGKPRVYDGSHKVLAIVRLKG